MLGVAVGKQEVAALIMPICGKVPVAVLQPSRSGSGYAEKRIDDRVLMDVDENKKPGCRWIDDLRRLCVGWNIPGFGMAIDRLAHVVAARARLRGIVCHCGMVRRAMVNRGVRASAIFDGD